MQIKSDRRLKDGDIAMSDAMPFAQHYEARTVFPLKEVLANPDFLTNVRHRLRAGDRLNIVRYENDDWHRVLEVIEGLRVVAVDNSGVELMRLFDPMTLDRQGEVGIVVARGFAGQFVIRIDGSTHASRNTIVEANEYAQALAIEKDLPVVLYEKKKAA